MTPEEDEATAPLFGTWRRAYWIVAGALAVEVGLLYACTRLLS